MNISSAGPNQIALALYCWAIAKALVDEKVCRDNSQVIASAKGFETPANPVSLTPIYKIISREPGKTSETFLIASS